MLRDYSSVEFRLTEKMCFTPVRLLPYREFGTIKKLSAGATMMRNYDRYGTSSGCVKPPFLKLSEAMIG